MLIKVYCNTVYWSKCVRFLVDLHWINRSQLLLKFHYVICLLTKWSKHLCNMLTACWLQTVLSLWAWETNLLIFNVKRICTDIFSTTDGDYLTLIHDFFRISVPFLFPFIDENVITRCANVVLPYWPPQKWNKVTTSVQHQQQFIYIYIVHYEETEYKNTKRRLFWSDLLWQFVVTICSDNL